MGVGASPSACRRVDAGVRIGSAHAFAWRSRLHPWIARGGCSRFRRTHRRRPTGTRSLAVARRRRSGNRSAAHTVVPVRRTRRRTTRGSRLKLSLQNPDEHSAFVAAAVLAVGNAGHAQTPMRPSTFAATALAGVDRSSGRRRRSDGRAESDRIGLRLWRGAGDHRRGSERTYPRARERCRLRTARYRRVPRSTRRWCSDRQRHSSPSEQWLAVVERARRRGVDEDLQVEAALIGDHRLPARPSPFMSPAAIEMGSF